MVRLLRTRRLSLVGLFVALALVGPASASGQTLDGPRVVRFGQSYPLDNTERVLLRGERLSDGSCRITHEGRIPKNKEMAAIEVAYDPERCRSLVEVGAWSGEDAVITGGRNESVSREHEEQSAEGQASQLKARAAAATRKRAYTWAWYDEPARWVPGQDVEDEGVLPPINWVRADVTWEPDGTCAVPTGAYGATDLYDYHFSQSGWSRISRRWEQPLQPGGSGFCSGPIYSRGFLHYRNIPFCPALGALPFVPPDPRGPTNTYYEPTAVEGYKDGTARYYWQATRKEGGCNELLRMGRRFGFTTTGPFGGP